MARKWHKFCWSVLLLAHTEQSDTFHPILLGCLCITFNNVYRELSSFIRRVSNFNPFSTTKLSCCYFILFLFDQCLCHCVIINDSGKKKGFCFTTIAFPAIEHWSEYLFYVFMLICIRIRIKIHSMFFATDVAQLPASAIRPLTRQKLDAKSKNQSPASFRMWWCNSDAADNTACFF